MFRQRWREQHPLEVYELVSDHYQPLGGGPLPGEPIWLPKIGLGLGREREWLYWYDKSGQRLLIPEERAQQEADRAQQEADRAAKLKELGVDPDRL